MDWAIKEIAFQLQELRTMHKDNGTPCLSLQEDTSLLLPVPWNHILWMSSSATPLRISICAQDHKYPGVGHREVNAPSHTKECHPHEPMEESAPKDWKKKQVRFEVGEDLGSDPTLPTELTTFLVGCTARVRRCSPPLYSLVCWSPMAASQQGSPALSHPKGRGCPKVPQPPTAQSQTQTLLKVTLDLVDHPNHWILEKMDMVGVHPHWWKEIRARKKSTMGIGPRRHIKWENFSEPEALHYA